MKRHLTPSPALASDRTGRHGIAVRDVSSSDGALATSALGTPIERVGHISALCRASRTVCDD